MNCPQLYAFACPTPSVRRISLAAMFLAGTLVSDAQTYSEWSNGGDSLFSNSANWSSGSASNYGQLEFKGVGSATIDNDLTSALSQWRLYFSGTQSYTLGSSGGQAINLFDFGGAFSWLLNDSSVTQTIGSTQTINFASTAGDTFAQISARQAGDLVLNGNLGITGSQVAQLRIASEAAGKVIIGGNISGTSKAVVFGLNEGGADVTASNIVLKGTNTFDNHAYVVAGTLSVEAGNLTSAGNVYLGQGSGTSAATINLTAPTGGLNISRPLYVRTGSTGLATLGASNASGTNTWSGAVSLEKDIYLNPSAGATLALTGGFTPTTAGIKRITAQGAGTTTLSGTTATGAGTLNLYKIDAGTLNIGASSAFSGNGVSSGNTTSPIVLMNGTTNQTAGTMGVTGEMIVGGPVTSGGAGTNVNFNMSGSSVLNVSSWLSIGRGNGIGGVTSTVTLNNSASINTANLGLGYNGGSGSNLPKAVLTLNDTSTVSVSGTPVNVAESAGSHGTINLNGTSTFTQSSASGALQVGGANGATGFINVNGGTGNFYRDLTLGYGGTGTGTLTLTTGTVNVASTTERWLILNGATGANSGNLIVDGGNLNLNTNTDIRMGTAGGSTGTNVVTLNGGAITGYSGNVSGGFSGGSVVDMNRAATGAINNTFNLNGGTLTIGQVLNSATGGTANFYFNGGTLKAAAASTSFFNLTGASHFAKVKNGGALIDSNGVNITIAEPLLADTGSTGGLTKSGAGTLTLSGTSTYTGNTNVDAGGLTLGIGGSAGTVRGTVNVAAGATLTTSVTDALGYSSGTQVATVNLNGNSTTPATFNSSTTGNNGYRTNFNLTASNVTSTGGGRIDFTTGGFGISSLASSVTSTWSAPIYIRDTATLPISTALGTTTSGIDLNISSVIGQQIAGSQITKSGAGTLGLSGTNTYTGATTVSAGTLLLTGGGSINASSGITVNGTGAKLVQASSVASTPAITLTNGGIDGVGTVGAVTVADASANAIANGNLTATTSLTTGNLTFSGDATLNLRKANDLTTAPLVSTGTLTTTPANGAVLINVLFGPAWANGSTYNIIGYGAFGGANSDFTVGTLSGLGARQSATVGNTGASNGFITLGISGDAPYWIGDVGANWTTTAQGSPFNWKLITAGTGTEFLTNDQVLFNDNATGTTAVDLSDADVTTATITFDNSALAYNIGSSGGYKFVNVGSFSKTGTNSVTISSANNAFGNYTQSAGTVTINSTGNTAGSLLLSAGTLAGSGSIAPTSSVVESGTISLALGGNGALSKNTSGTATLSGNSTFTGVATLNAGTLNLNSSGALGSGSTTFTINGGTIDNTSGSAVTLSSTRAQNWAADFSFGGSNDLNMNSGAVTIPAGTRTLTLGGKKLTTGRLSGGTTGNLSLVGTGRLALTQSVSSSLGTLNVGSGTTLQINTGADAGTTADLIVTGLAGTGTIENGGGVERWVYADVATTQTFDGTLANGSGGGVLGFYKNQAGVLTLTGSNTYTGRTTIAGGTLSVSSIGNVGVASNIGAGFAGTDALHISNGTLLYTGTDVTTDRGFTSNAPSANSAIISTTNNLTLSGVVASGGAGGFIKRGTGTLTLTNAGTNSLNAGTNGGNLVFGLHVEQGKLVLQNGTFNTTGETVVGGQLQSSGSYAAGQLEINNGATLNNSNWFSIGRANGTTGLSSVVTVTDATLNVTNSGNGLAMGFSNGLSGFNAAPILNVSGTGVVNVAGSLNAGENAGATTSINLTGSGSINLTNGTQANKSVAVGGTGSLTLADSSAFNAGASGFYIAENAGSTGTINLNGGTLSSGPINRNATSTATVNFNGGTLKALASSTTFFTNGLTNANVQAGGAKFDTNGFDITVVPALIGSTGDGGVYKTGNGTLTLSGSNTHNGKTIVDAGTLSVASDGNLGTAPATAVADQLTLKEGARLLVTDTTTLPANRGITVSSSVASGDSGTIEAAAGKTVTISAPIVKDGTTLELKGNTGSVIKADGVISGSSANSDLIVNGGTTQVSAANTYNGPTKLTGDGVLEVLGVLGSISTSTAISIEGGTLLLSGSAPDRVGNSTPVALLNPSVVPSIKLNGSITETMGALTLAASTQVIDMGAGAGVITFSSLSGTSGQKLQIWNYSGIPVVGGGTDQLLISSGTLSGITLADIEWYSDNGVTAFTAAGQGAFMTGGNELVPVPEPGTIAGLLGLFGAASWRNRRRAQRNATR